MEHTVSMSYAVWIVLFPLIGVVLWGLLLRKMPEKVVGWGASLMIGLSFVVAVMLTLKLASLDPHHRVVEVEIFRWITAGGLELDFAFLVDPLSAVMMLVVTGVSFLIHIYSIGYMHGDSRYSLFFTYLNLFVFFMLILVLGNNLPILFIGWEGVGLCSYLLIGFWWEDQNKAEAGMKAFVVNRIGDFGMLIAIFMLYFYLGTLKFTDMHPAAVELWGHNVGALSITVITLALLLGATGKSAQIPLFVWLPDAMAGPTPVSALIHAATMVTAGVYMIARNATLFALSPVGMGAVALIGAATAIVAATIGLKQMDIKKVLAYSTVSQLGYMVMACGVGAFTAGVFHLMTHAFFKALLFLGSGAVIHTMHGALHHVHDHHTDPQDMRNMGGLAKHIKVTYAVFLIATLAIAGIPGLSGFFSKDEILAHAYLAAVYEHNPVALIAWALGLMAAGITAFYMFRLVFLTFHGRYKGPEGSEEGLHESPPVMLIPLVVLAILSIIGGYVGVPHLPPLPHIPHYLGDWLQPVFHQAHEILLHNHGLHHAPHLSVVEEWVLVGASVLVAILGIVGAFVVYRLMRAEAKPDEAQAGFGKTLFNKYYIDEIYNAVVIRPLIGFCRLAWKYFDAGVIDGGLVMGTAKTVRWFGAPLRRVQTGIVANYAFWLALGVAGVLLAFLIR